MRQGLGFVDHVAAKNLVEFRLGVGRTFAGWRAGGEFWGV